MSDRPLSPPGCQFYQYHFQLTASYKKPMNQVSSLIIPFLRYVAQAYPCAEHPTECCNPQLFEAFTFSESVSVLDMTCRRIVTSCSRFGFSVANWVVRSPKNLKPLRSTIYCTSVCYLYSIATDSFKFRSISLGMSF